MSSLFSPLVLREVSFPNRIVVSPMCQYSAEEGSATDWHLMHLGSLALSGAGLLFTEATAVEPDGRITRHCLGLWSDANEAALARVVAFCGVHARVRLGMQLAHAGRKASTRRPWEGRDPLDAGEGAWQTWSSSARPHAPGWPAPLPLDEGGMARVRDAFAAAARRADRLGLEVLEIHAAHGYLLHQFLSPVANDRTDAWGGALENRMRFPLEVFEAVRSVWPAGKALGVRISATDWVRGGWDVEDSIRFVAALGERGCDYVTASSGGISEAQQIPLGPGYQVPLARRIRRETGVPVMAVGMIFEPAHAEAIVREADLVALARGLLFDPHWPWGAAVALGGDIVPPPQYERAWQLRFLQETRARELGGG